MMQATKKMQQFSFTELFIDQFEYALHVSGDKLAHLQEHFLTVYTALVQCTDIAADRWQGWVLSQPCHWSAAISVHCTKAVYTVKSAPEDGWVCRPKQIEQIQIDQ